MILSTTPLIIWNCQGKDRGSSATCSYPKPISGSCGSTTNACSSGLLLILPTTPTNYLWNCQGKDRGSSATCSYPKPISGSCGSSVNSCSVGLFDRYRLHLSGARAPRLSLSGQQPQRRFFCHYYLWNCQGKDGGSSATCSYPKPISGSCVQPQILAVAGFLLILPTTQLIISGIVKEKTEAPRLPVLIQSRLAALAVQV